MDINFETGNDFELFKEKIRSRLKNRNFRTLEDTHTGDAAVEILIMNRDNAPHILLTKRSDKVRNHKGQVSLPGGVFDEEDGDIINTAFRETFEEVGVPREKIDYLGRFDDYFSLFGYRVSCFVGAIEHPFDYVFSIDEIDDHIEAPLSIFMNLQYERYDIFHFDGKDRKVYHYNYKGFHVWGLTASMLTDFSRRICMD